MLTKNMITFDSIRMKIYDKATVHVVGGGASGRAVLKLLESCVYRTYRSFFSTTTVIPVSPTW